MKPVLKKKLRFIFLLLLSPLCSLAQNPGKCISYSADKNKVVFTCENGIKVLLQLCSGDVIKVRYAADKNPLKNPTSFAIINDSLEKAEVHIDEKPQSYELFTANLIIRVNKNPFQIRFFDKYQKLLLEDYQDKGFVKEDKKITSFKTLKPDEQFFGLGEKAGSLNRRGKTFKMWNSDKPCYSVNEDPLYKSIPFFMSNNGYGIFFDNTYKSQFKFGNESDQYYSWEAPGGDMIYYFIYGPDYKQIIGKYTQLTGNPIMPPKWAFGFSQCRGMLTNEKLTREIAKGYRDRNIPCDIIYQDIGWVNGLQNFEWRKGNYIDPKQMLGDLKQQGFKVIVSQDPVISQSTHKQWQEADSLGYFTKDTRTEKSYDMPWPWGGNCGVVDFTKPEVADWWGNYQQKPINDGVKGFWTDMGEPAWSNEESTERLSMKHYLGMHNEIHNVYGLTWDKVVTEQFEKHNPGKRIFQMTRAGFAGLQRYTFGWSGDSGDGNDVLNGWNKLSNQIPLALSAGMGLIPFWACDISGYCGDIKDYNAFAELYVRWTQFGVFNPLSRAHHEGNNAVEPWLFGEEAERIIKKSIELKYQLFPYFYTYAREAYDTGLPLMRAMFLEYPSDEEAYKAETQFLLGKELLIAPVVKKSARTRKIYLPEGNWVDFNNPKKIFEGDQWIDYPVTLESLPVFAKEGSVIPMMPVMQYIGEKENYPLILNIFPPANNENVSFNLYEDDGESTDYKQNIGATNKFVYKSQKDAAEIIIEDRKINGYQSSGKRNFLIQVHLDKKPRAIETGTRKVKETSEKNVLDNLEKDYEKNLWSWNEASGVCSIKTFDSGKVKTIKLIK